MAGGLAGAKAGGVVAGPAGAFTGALAGGAIGSLGGTIAPEATLEFLEVTGLMPPGSRNRLGLTPEELSTLAQGEVLLDLTTSGGLSFARSLQRVGTKALSGIAGDGRRLADAAAQHGIHLMPVQLGDRTVGRGFVSVVGRFPWISGNIKKHGQAAERAFKAAVEGAPHRIAPVIGMDDLSARIYNDATNLVDSVSKKFSAQYDALWQKAESAGVEVVPRAVVRKAEDLLDEMTRRTAVGIDGKPLSPGPALEKVSNFIENEILPMREAVEGGTAYARQTFRQMDGLLSRIDQEIAAMEPGVRRVAKAKLVQLRQAAQLDMAQNVRGPGAQEISDELKRIDRDFSHTISELFETATAKRFASVKKQGLRGIAIDDATRTPVDKLAKIVLDLDSPQSIDELRRIVSPDTFKNIAAQAVDNAVQASYVRTGPEAGQLNVATLSKHLGVDNPNSPKAKAFKRLLKESGSPLQFDDFATLIRAGEAISSAEIPNVSTFIARRATLGGLQGLINGVVPGMVLAGGASAVGTYGGSLVGAAVFIGGGRMLAAMLSDPLAARHVATVLDKEATRLVKRKAALGALRIGINALREGAEEAMEESDAAVSLGAQEIERLLRFSEDVWSAIEDQIGQ
ncbi:MAG: hypothetical protein ACK4RK_21970 [Gemmataceae bacterium]